MKTLTIELSDSEWAFCERLVDEGAYPDVNAVLTAALVLLVRMNARARAVQAVAGLLRRVGDDEVATLANRTSTAGDADTLKALLKACGSL